MYTLKIILIKKILNFKRRDTFIIQEREGTHR